MEPTSRPSFLEITQRLEGILEQQLGAEGTVPSLQADGEAMPTPKTPAALNGTVDAPFLWAAYFPALGFPPMQPPPLRPPQPCMETSKEQTAPYR